MPVLLFTQIENADQLLEMYPAEMGDGLARHDVIVQRRVESSGGRVFRHEPGGIFAAFESGDPLQCALDLQHQVHQQDWGSVGDLRVCTALHAGDAEQQGENYVGPTVDRNAKILGVGWGGLYCLASTSRIIHG